MEPTEEPAGAENSVLELLRPPIAPGIAAHGGGLALRFALVKGYRTDKKASEADTIQTVTEIFPPARVTDAR